MSLASERTPFYLEATMLATKNRTGTTFIPFCVTRAKDVPQCLIREKSVARRDGHTTRRQANRDVP